MKKTILLLILLFVSPTIFAFHPETQTTVIKNGIGLGSMIAVVISWERNKSILFAIIHGTLSWLYVVYYYFLLKED